MSVLAEMYHELDAVLNTSNILQKHKHFHVPGADVDDLRQEVRLEVLRSMEHFDFNRAGGELLPFMRRIASNTFNDLYARSRRLYRNPHAAIVNDNGDRSRVLLPQSDYNTVSEVALEAAEPDACDSIIQQEARDALGDLVVELLGQLGDQECEVLMARLNPSPELQAAMEEVGELDWPSNLTLAKHLGLSKSVMDWIWYKIRFVFTQIASEERFSELFGEEVSLRGWPVAHVSRGKRFHSQFVARTLASRSLDNQPIRPATVERSSLGSRTIQEYRWGCVLGVSLGKVVWTAVLEGRFNPRTGELFGATGARKFVPIRGYRVLALSLAEGAVSEKQRLTVLPACVGEYESGHPGCDGNKVNQPCKHRDTCVAFQTRLRLKNTSKGQYLSTRVDPGGVPYAVPNDPEKWAAAINEIIETYDIKGGKVGRGRPAPRKHKLSEAREARLAERARFASQQAKGQATPRPLSAVARASQLAKIRRRGAPHVVRRSEASRSMDEWLKQFIGVVVEGTQRRFKKDDLLAAPGQLFIHDRRLTSGYVALYCRREDGKETAVALLQYKPSVRRMTLKLPVAVKDLGGLSIATMKSLAPVGINEGSWRLAARELDQAQVALGAEVVVKLYRQGILKLPEA